MLIGHELAEEGCKHLQVLSLLDYVDKRIGKFKGRRDRLQRLSEIASLACLSVEQEEAIFLYSPLDILNHKEQLDWIVPNLIHKQGFCIITGAPGVGKTQLGLQLLKSMCTATEFLSRPIETPQRCLFMSLEMSITELKYIFEHQNRDFQEDPLWVENLRTMDQSASLLDYEEVIAEFEPNVILVDSLIELATDDIKEAESRAITRWIKKIRRRYNTAFVCIHHNRKESAGGKNKAVGLSDVYGSFIFGKDAETVLNLWQDPASDDIEYSSFKTRYDQKFDDVLRRSDNLIYTRREEASSDSDGEELDDGKIGLAFQ